MTEILEVAVAALDLADLPKTPICRLSVLPRCRGTGHHWAPCFYWPRQFGRYQPRYRRSSFRSAAKPCRCWQGNNSPAPKISETTRLVALLSDQPPLILIGNELQRTESSLDQPITDCKLLSKMQRRGVGCLTTIVHPSLKLTAFVRNALKRVRLNRAAGIDVLPCGLHSCIPMVLTDGGSATPIYKNAVDELTARIWLETILLALFLFTLIPRIASSFSIRRMASQPLARLLPETTKSSATRV